MITDNCGPMSGPGPNGFIIDGSQTNREAIIACDGKSRRRAGLDAFMLRHFTGAGKVRPLQRS
jgi:hypothetical protein